VAGGSPVPIFFVSKISLCNPDHDLPTLNRFAAKVQVWVLSKPVVIDSERIGYAVPTGLETPSNAIVVIPAPVGWIKIYEKVDWPLPVDFKLEYFGQ